MAARSADRPRLRLAARLLIVGVWTALGGLFFLAVVTRATAILAGVSEAGPVGGLLGGSAALYRGALVAVLLGCALAVVGGAAVLAAVR